MTVLRRAAAILLAPLLALAAPAPGAAADPAGTGPSPTPYQGWNTYYGLGGDFTADEVLDVADFLVASGLAEAGYDIVWLDGGWQADVPRGADGRLQGDAERFPEGMAALADAIHDRGLRAGIYTDAGPYIPGTCGLGSGGHYQTDADTFAEWGYDAVKVDFLCGIAADLDPEEAFTAFARALRANSAGRSMIFNLCNPVTSPDWGDYPPEQQSTWSWTYAPGIAESWRTFTDVGFVGQIRYQDVLRNFDANARHPEVAGPGHFSDPDYLGPELGMTTEEFRTQMSLWSVAAAPLVISSDPRTLSQESLDVLLDDDVLAIDQDRLGIQGTRVGPAGTTEAWAKPLADGSVAVALLNRGDAPAEVATTARDLGLRGRSFTVLDTWTDERTQSSGTVRAAVPAHGTALLRVTPARPDGVPRLVAAPPVVTAVGSDDVAPTTDALAAAGDRLTAEVTLHNDGSTPVRSPRVTPVVPDGWTARPLGTAPRVVRPGGTATVAFVLDVPTDAATGGYPLAARVTSGAGRVTTPPSAVTVAPAAPSGAAVALSRHPWVSATSGWLEPTVDASVGGGSPLTVAGVVHETGLGVASASVVRYHLGGACTGLAGAVGIDDVVDTVGPEGGTATFAVVGDGALLWSSGTVERGAAVPFDLDVTGVRDLSLRVADAGDGGYNDRADWLSLTARC
ncbi:NPCBM/NEW2 domain-containing protein [Promicromonospora citrea]|uniref:Alpha-galactosidase n=1 Tax=Promicromonospora citrea TaxID=43677 RepID=A0A8H9L441_9MICO|nr:NPCBM/NEW2 domain-containing protein [Promicromonospora citrea]NNH54053.1 alpha-galactosidase [Promicromonospora citrea]GGM17454.1 alpha-galactosidase [Promicromonospora citrea]